MSEFFEHFVQFENVLFSTSLLIFAGLLGLQLLGLFGDAVVDGFDGNPNLTAGDVDGAADAAKFPLVFMLMPFFLSFGLLGLLSNWMLPRFLHIGTGYIMLISVGASGLFSWEFSKLVAGSIGQLLPSVESYGLSGADLTGCLGKVVSARLGQQEPARISVTDARGGNYTLQGQLIEGHPEVSRGELIRVVGHDASSNVCFCEPVT
jgi:hypothetical protein